MILPELRLLEAMLNLFANLLSHDHHARFRSQNDWTGASIEKANTVEDSTHEGKLRRMPMKGYIVGFKSRESANHEIVDYWFSSSPNDAMRWQLRELAEADVRHFNRGIAINEDIQRPHTLSDFQIQVVEDGFLVWVDGPFVVRGSGRAPQLADGAPQGPSSSQT